MFTFMLVYSTLTQKTDHLYSGFWKPVRRLSALTNDIGQILGIIGYSAEIACNTYLKKHQKTGLTSVTREMLLDVHFDPPPVPSLPPRDVPETLRKRQFEVQMLAGHQVDTASGATFFVEATPPSCATGIPTLEEGEG
jgi:hypothetical protein